MRGSSLHRPTPTTSGLPRRAPTTTWGSSRRTTAKARAPSVFSIARRTASASGSSGHLLDEVRHHLGVGVGAEDVAPGNEVILELEPVLDDPVVCHRHLLGAVTVGMCVACGWGTVGSPPGVPDAGASLGAACHLDGIHQIGDPAGASHHSQDVTVVDCQPCRVVAPILQALQPGDKDVDSGPRPYIADYAAHAVSSFPCPASLGNGPRGAML